MAHYVPLSAQPPGFDLKALADREGRRYSYLRLSVTDRCDFRCEYCMPETGEVQHERRADLLTFDETERVVGIFVRLGVRRLRFTGGEPFVRRDFVRLVEQIAEAFPQLALALTRGGSPQSAGRNRSGDGGGDHTQVQHRADARRERR